MKDFEKDFLGGIPNFQMFIYWPTGLLIMKITAVHFSLLLNLFFQHLATDKRWVRKQ